jgi:hypothetical protein
MSFALERMSLYRQDPIDLNDISTYPLASRPSKVSVADFARALTDDEIDGVAALLDSLPQILGAQTLRDVAGEVAAAKASGRAIIWGLGGHVFKTGLAPVLINLIEQGFVTAIALNGSGVIHDFEIALAGSTSEDVDQSLGSGTFGMAEETGRLINQAINAGSADGIGLGESVGRAISLQQPPHAAFSLLGAAYAARVPVTVHVTLGADIIHLHPQADGGALGAASHRDFKLLCTLVKGLDGGGVYLNIGSAVTLPEVFLKAVTTVRNLGGLLENFSTVNLDFIQQYRPLTNVVRRPVADGAGRGYNIVGHHELMLPLLAAAIRLSERVART